MEASDTSFSLSSLLCQENESSLNEFEEEAFINWNPCSVSEYEDEYIQQLIQKESIFESNSSSLSADVCLVQDQNWLKSARLSALKWILETRDIFGFKFSTAFLSLTYFDRFLSRRSIDNGKLWAIRLLSVACLSLAAKMEERKVPALSEYRTHDYDFEDNVILRMELLVLNTLEWGMNAITPFSYLHNFTTNFCLVYGVCRPKEIVCGAIEHILAIAEEINLMDVRPSVVAVAAVVAASGDQYLTRKTMEIKMSVISSWGSLKIEDVCSCYSIMQEIKKGKSKTPKSVLLSTNSSSTDALEKSSITSPLGIKRRLTYNDFDQQCPLHKVYRT